MFKLSVQTTGDRPQLKLENLLLCLLVLSVLPFSALTYALASMPLKKRLNSDYLIQEVIAEAKKSYYSDLIYLPLKFWPPKGFPNRLSPDSAKKNPVWMRGVSKIDDPFYIGAVKQIWIQAPIKRISSLIENFENYTELFEGVTEVRVTRRDGNKVVTYWERERPFFLASKIYYHQVYIIDHVSEKRVVYRYQLIQGNYVFSSDGLIVLEAYGNLTRLTAFDFYLPDLGVGKIIGEKEIWKRGLEGSYKGDIAFKTKAEHPDWKLDQLKQESERMLNQFPVEPIQYFDHFQWGSP